MSADDSAPRRARGRPRGWDDKTEQNTIKSLDRAMAVLEHLSTREGMGLSALATETGQSAATIYRILVTLQTRELVEFDPAEQLWHVGPRAFTIGARYLRRSGLIERARPILRRLMQQTGETANLGIERRGQVLFLSQVETHENIRAFFPPGTLSPMHASGIGKALLAAWDAPRLAAWLSGRELERFTPRTITDGEALAADLAAVRLRGHALDDEERDLGMRCIAAPVFDLHAEPVAGLSVSGPVARMGRDATARIAEAVMAAAARLTVDIAGRRP